MNKNNIWKFLYDCVQKNIPAILMIVTEAGGETPGKAGFKMAITACRYLWQYKTWCSYGDNADQRYC